MCSTEKIETILFCVWFDRFRFFLHSILAHGSFSASNNRFHEFNQIAQVNSGWGGIDWIVCFRNRIEFVLAVISQTLWYCCVEMFLEESFEIWKKKRRRHSKRWFQCGILVETIFSCNPNEIIMQTTVADWNVFTNYEVWSFKYVFRHRSTNKKGLINSFHILCKRLNLCVIHKPHVEKWKWQTWNPLPKIRKKIYSIRKKELKRHREIN